MPEYRILYIVVAGMFGLLMGSFLNVCIYRIPRDLSIVLPRSFCIECGHQIAWYDNVPLLSYVVLRARCRHCAKPIGMRYPTVELSACLLLAFVAYRYGWTAAAGKWMLFELLMTALFWTDLEERILPDELTLGGIAAGVCLAFVVHVHGPLVDLLLPAWRPVTRSVFNAALGAALLIPLWVLGWAISRLRHTEALGLGDVKLVALIGIFLGFEASIPALMIGSVAGSLAGIAYAWRSRQRILGTELPMGSFFCFGAAILPLVIALN